jgi:hypothetical protein
VKREICDLDETQRPLFGRHNIGVGFDSDTHVGLKSEIQDLSGAGFEAIEPAVALVNRIITLPEQLPFWHGLIRDQGMITSRFR